MTSSNRSSVPDDRPTTRAATPFHGMDLNFDDDAPTKIALRPEGWSCTTMVPPPQVGPHDVFLLTGGRQRVRAQASNPNVRISEIMGEAPVLANSPLGTDVDLSLFAQSNERPSSIAPVSMPEPEAPAHTPRSGRGSYWFAIAGLAAAAVAVFAWRALQPTPTSGPMAAVAPQTTAPETTSTPAKVVELAPISIEVDVPARETRARSVMAATPAPVQTAAVEVPSSDPEPQAVEAEQPEAPAEPAKPALEPFDRDSAQQAINSAAQAALAQCREPDAPSVRARVSVTIAPSGRVTTAVVDGPRLAGTAAGGCIARTFRAVRVQPFDGPVVTVHKSFLF